MVILQPYEGRGMLYICKARTEAAEPVPYTLHIVDSPWFNQTLFMGILHPNEGHGKLFICKASTNATEPVQSVLHKVCSSWFNQTLFMETVNGHFTAF